MILITLGTQDKSFERLLKQIDKLVAQKIIKDKIIVQAGYTKYESKNMEIFALIEPDKLEKLIKKCDVLITHGGVGSIMSGIFNHKKVIAIPRLAKYNEHTNDHQLEIIKSFADLGYIKGCTNLKDLGNIIADLKSFKPQKFKSNNKQFKNIITDFIDNN